MHTPVEAILAKYIDDAPNEPTKKWLATNFRNWLLKTPENLHRLPYLPRNATEQQKKAFSFNDLWDIRLTSHTETMIDHIMDFFKANPELPRLERMSVENVVQAADEATRRYNAQQAKQAKQVENNPGVVTLMEFAGGYRMVELTNQPALDREGTLMGHCVGSMHGCYVADRTRRIFSLRDGQNEPHATIEVMADDMETTEIKGRQNAAPVRRYWPMLQQFIHEYKIKVSADYRNLGLLNIMNPVTREAMMLTQDQFRDMVHDPNNEVGQGLLRQYQERPSDDSDVALGMFTALYGTDQLNDSTVKVVFNQSTTEAIQVVQHYGNRLTPEQLVLAFSAMSVRRGGHDYMQNSKMLLTATKPDAHVVGLIIDSLTDSASRDEYFVAALSQALPDTYRTLIEDPAALEKELADENNSRSAGPFFAFAGNHHLTTQMVTNAFRHYPEEALKRMMGAKLSLSDDALQAAFLGSMNRYWGHQSAPHSFFDKLVAYTKPNRDVLRSVFQHVEHGHERGTLLLTAVKHHMPDQLDKDLLEDAILSIDTEDIYRRFLPDEPEPSLRVQQRMFDKDKERTFASPMPRYMYYLRKVDQSIFQQIINTLRPTAIPTSEIEQTSRVQKDGSYKHSKWRRPLTAEERTEAIDAERKAAIGRFLALLRGATKGTDLDQVVHSPQKLRDAQNAFAQLGKSKLFDVAISRIAHNDKIHRLRNDRSAFQHHLAEDPSLTASDISKLIGDTYSIYAEWFDDVINFAPQRVPEVIITTLSQRSSSKRVYGDLDGQLDKEKTFQSLEAVWASTKLSYGIKDDYTLKVFKRFKPASNKLLDMLEKANSEEATKYVLKKTKRPSRDLITWVVDGFPDLMTLIPLDAIPDDLLANIFREEPEIAISLMDRDLRSYGADSRGKWAYKEFRSKIDRKSDSFARYQTAAQAGGKANGFARYARQAELEDTHHSRLRTRKGVDYHLLQKHLHEYSDRTLVEVAHHDNTAETYKLYFDTFDETKLARLINGELFQARYSYDNSSEQVIHLLDTQKLRDSLLIAIKQGKTPGSEHLVDRMIFGKFKFDDALVVELLKAEFPIGKLARGKVGDLVKNWIADNKPQDMDAIREPNQYMIKVLFDNYAQLTKDTYKSEKGKDHIKVDYWFEYAVESWFNNGPSYDFKYKPHKRVADMLKAEALRRKGIAVVVLLATFRHMLTRKNRNDHARVHVPPLGAPISDQKN